jgi:hypothetical protein
MLPGPRLGLFVEPVDERLELLAVHPPDATAPDLDRGELARPDESVDLRNAHAQIGRDILESHEARFHGNATGGREIVLHTSHCSTRSACCHQFSFICARLPVPV